MLARLQTSRGFTLIELLVALSMSIIVLAALVSSLFSQQKVHMTQDRLIEMQQDLRSAVYLFGADVKMAGYDPTGGANATFLIADQAEIQFQIDRNGDGDFTDPGPPVTSDPMEVIRYALTNDANRDGIADGTPCDLGREYRCAKFCLSRSRWQCFSHAGCQPASDQLGSDCAGGAFRRKSACVLLQVR